MIRRGLRIDEDDDAVSPIKEQKVSLDANRKKDAFEQDMDSLLFGGAPVRRRQPKKQLSQQKSQISPSKVVMITPQKSKPSTTKKSDQLTQYKSLQFEQKVLTEKLAEKSVQLSQNRTKTTPNKKQQNESLKSSRASRHQSSVIIPKQDALKKYLQDRQQSTTVIEIENSRPNYICKFKNVCETFNFAQENRIKHKHIDVVRSIICSRKYMENLDNKGFKDKQFPPDKIFLGVQYQNYDVRWQKYESFVNQATLGKYIDPNDIKKGQFSSYKFLSTLSVLAQRQQNIKRLIEDQYFNPENGMYFVRLFINSVWRYYVVDSYIPFFEDQPAGAISYNDNESDMWVALIQKAYAKAFDGYGVFQRPQPREYYLRDLTGAPTKNYKIDNPQILDIVKNGINRKKVIMAVPKSNISFLGINSNYNLTVLNVNKKGGLTLRYSWPMVEESGQFLISNQGIIQFSDTQMLEYLSHITITHVNRQYFTTTIQARHEKDFYIAYKIIIKQKTHGYFTLSQFDERQFPKDSYSYQPARLFIHKKTEDNKYEYIKGGFSHKERNLDVQVELVPGQYQLFAFVNWNQQVYDFNLTFYGSRSVEFIKIPTVKNHNMISLGLQSYNLQNGKRSALGHVHQFINYYEETNLVLITVVNTSSKEYKYTNDMQKINFQSLSLINLTNNQHNCLQDLSTKQLQVFKLNISQNRKWQITLGPQQTFTWVISTTQNYDPNNFRNWGFR